VLCVMLYSDRNNWCQFFSTCWWVHLPL